MQPAVQVQSLPKLAFSAIQYNYADAVFKGSPEHDLTVLLARPDEPMHEAPNNDFDTRLMLLVNRSIVVMRGEAQAPELGYLKLRLRLFNGGETWYGNIIFSGNGSDFRR